jgi:hypothetical protein
MAEIDARIKSLAHNWEFDRIAKIDLAILRLAMFEMMSPQGHPAGRLDQRGDRPLEAVFQRRRQALHQRHPRPPEGPARPRRPQSRTIRMTNSRHPEGSPTGVIRISSFCIATKMSMFGLFKKFKDGLAKTVSAIAEKTHGLCSADARSTPPRSTTLEEALYTADFGVETTEEILAEIKEAPARTRTCRARRPPPSAPPCSRASSPEARAD